MQAKSVDKRRLTCKDIVTLPFYHNPVISPDGTKIVYTKVELNLRTNSMSGNCYVYDSVTQKNIWAFEDGIDAHWLDEKTFSLVRHSPTGSPRWSDIYIVDSMVGAGRRVVGHSSRISDYVPFAGGFLYTSSKQVDRSPIGNFRHVENEKSSSALYYASIDRFIKSEHLERMHFEEEQFVSPPYMFELSKLLNIDCHITSIVTSSSAGTIYVNCQAGPELYFEYDTLCFKIEIDPEAILHVAKDKGLDAALKDSRAVQLNLPKSFKIAAVSPDGTRLIVEGPPRTEQKEPPTDLWLVSASNVCSPKKLDNSYEHLQRISETLDRHPNDVQWTKDGIFVRHWDESRTCITKISETGECETYDFGGISPKSKVNFSENNEVSFIGFSQNELEEVYHGKYANGQWDIDRVTRLTEEFAHLDFGTVESIKWTSKDGTEIEGLLRKPSDFDQSKKYPLVILPHGGPRGSSPFTLMLKGDYGRPGHPLLGRGVLIFEPNYRGGLGKGREFMTLNFGNLGVGDMWDIESGLDYLIDQGFVDESKIGSMGGSQGGYLSAFIGMHTDRCAAVIVNAGVSSWYLYYISSDMRQTVHLPGTPFVPEGREAFLKSAPIAAIERAKTPMLLQHGELDERISVVSAHELHRALKDKGVHTEMFTYPGLGHGYLRPRENYAVLLQAYRWLCHYLLGDELDFFKDDF